MAIKLSKKIVQGAAEKKAQEAQKKQDVEASLMDEFYTVKEVAQLFKLSEVNIRRMIKSGDIKHLHAGSQIRISKAALVDFILGK